MFCPINMGQGTHFRGNKIFMCTKQFTVLVISGSYISSCVPAYVYILEHSVTAILNLRYIRNEPTSIYNIVVIDIIYFPEAQFFTYYIF